MKLLPLKYVKILVKNNVEFLTTKKKVPIINLSRLHSDGAFLIIIEFFRIFAKIVKL